jgi:DNA replication protein DnaC
VTRIGGGHQVEFAALAAAHQLPDLTDEEWDERDAQIQSDLEAKEAEERGQADERRRELLLEREAPERAVDGIHAPSFMETSEACLALYGLQNDARSIRVLAGGVGSGKTFAAVWWLAQYGGPSPLFMRVSEFETISRYDKEHRRRWKTASALVLDDLGAEYADGKGNLLADLDELIDVYSGRTAQLIITTNLKPDQFKERYKSRIVSRLRAGARWKSLTGGDMGVAK